MLNVEISTHNKIQNKNRKTKDFKITRLIKAKKKYAK
jgi:hypothetical protein